MTEARKVPKTAPGQHPKPPEGTWTEHDPELDTAPVSYENSISPEFFELEREAVFKRAWLNVGRVEQVPRKGGFFKANVDNEVVAVNDVSLTIQRGECLGLVGESGCGKTTLSKMIMRAVSPDSGTVTFDNGAGPIDILQLGGDALKAFRPRLQMVFQDPFSSLSPRMTVLNILREPLQIHNIGNDAERLETITRRRSIHADQAALLRLGWTAANAAGSGSICRRPAP